MVHELVEGVRWSLSLSVWLDIIPSGSTKRTRLIIFWIFASFFDLSQTGKKKKKEFLTESMPADEHTLVDFPSHKDVTHVVTSPLPQECIVCFERRH